MTDTDKAALLSLEVGPESKPKSFTPAEMITCDVCLRANPPTRTDCFYCAAKLPAGLVREEVRPLVEAGLQSATTTEGHCVVLPKDQASLITESSLAGIASLLRIKSDELQSAIVAGGPLPLLRATTAEPATQLAEDMRALGLEVVTLADEALNLNVPIRKIRAVEFSEKSLTGLAGSSGERISASWEDLILIVSGRLVVNRVEVEERRRRRRQQHLDTRELFSDESMLDLYTRSNESGWRIAASTFDFSCLGSNKAFTAFENFAALIDLLRERGKNVEVDQSYVRARPLLAKIWPLETKTQPGEWRRSGAGKVDVSTVTTTDNEAQFNNYSRLLHYLKLRELESSR